MSTLTKTTTVIKKIKTNTKVKNKVLAFRFALTPELDLIIKSLENCFLGLDRTEILKLALNQLYKSNRLDKVQEDIINEIAHSKSTSFNSEEDFFDYWNKNKADFRI